MLKEALLDDSIGSWAFRFALNFAPDAMKEDELPSACPASGERKAPCPQDIDIPGTLAKFVDVTANITRLGPPDPARQARRFSTIACTACRPR